ncbi:MAG: two-component sensor histidine kinase [Flavobacteriaceae bacterium]|nr:two-component sensor histidine kinase [Flavobacteriaceae bacterium]
MNNSKYKWTLYLIVAVILSTIAIQWYWNYKNYQVNKQHLIVEVQNSLDKAINNYFAKLSEISFITTTQENNIFPGEVMFNNSSNILNYKSNKNSSLNPVVIDIGDGNISFSKNLDTDYLDQHIQHIHENNAANRINNITGHILNEKADSTLINHLKNLSATVAISMINNTINIENIEPFFRDEIEQKKLGIKHQLHLSHAKHSKDSIEELIAQKSELLVQSQSTFLPDNSTIYASFSDTTKEILKRSLTGIIISTFLVLTVISCLFYLLIIIKHQKQLAELKNDLISNITHEFKTPIATIGVALESIKDFDMINDKVKTKSYLSMSSIQLNKLNIMVEKILETATLNSQNLQLDKTTVNLVDLIEGLLKKHTFNNDKLISFETDKPKHDVDVDIFHFENALNNIIDNAIKYGGSIITIHLKEASDRLVLTISDNGNTLTKAHKDRIFEKFYRVPKGNTHDIKGFGIGLYYTKTIVEKHNGTIALELSRNLTTFKTQLPYDK